MQDAPTSASAAIVAGLKGRCPRCGQGALFRSGLALREKCDRCGLSYAFADSGDGPAVFAILILGFLVLGAALHRRVPTQSAGLGARRAVGPGHAGARIRAAARTQGRADRATVQAPGRRGASRPRLKLAHDAPQAATGPLALADPAGDCRLGRPDRARHLAARAQGVEGSAARQDRRPRRRRSRAASPQPCRRGAMAATSNTCTSPSPAASCTTRSAISTRPPPRASPGTSTRRWRSAPVSSCGSIAGMVPDASKAPAAALPARLRAAPRCAASSVLCPSARSSRPTTMWRATSGTGRISPP